jgi:hypothetical protein
MVNIMRKPVLFTLCILLLCMSSTLFIGACDTTKMPQASTKSSASPTEIELSPTAITLPSLVADPGWNVVYNHAGDTTHLVTQSFTAENSYALIGTCLGTGSMIVHIDPGESATIPCSHTAQPITEDRYSSSSGQVRTVRLDIQGNKIQWSVLVEISNTSHY